MLKNIFTLTMFMAVVLLLAMLTIPRALASPSAVTFTVDSILDQPDDLTIPGTCHTAANTCTLRAAVMQANRTSGLGATIMLPSGTYTLTIPAAGADGEANGDLNLTTPSSGSSVITLIGAGASTTIIDANQINRVFSIAAGCTVIITGVTIRDGDSLFDGGGIANNGTLTVSDTAIYGNHTDYSGGGILNNATLTMNNSAIYNNYAANLGGGIYNNGTLTVSNSAVHDNHAITDGGGIDSNGTLTVINSTLSQNSADHDGGGMHLAGPSTIRNSLIYANGADNGGGILTIDQLYVVNSTVSGNYAYGYGGGINNADNTFLYNTSVIDNDANHNSVKFGSGGGVYADAGSRFVVVNTLIAGNTNHGSFPRDCDGTLEAYGWNLFGGISNCTFTGNGDAARGFISLSTIGALQDNGGPTWTHALLPGSEAIDTTTVQGCVDETGALLPTDQRGAVRPVGARCDVGAFEYRPTIYLYLPLVLR